MIVVEDGKGSNPSANSYADVAMLRSYANMVKASLPSADEDCASLLLEAMTYLDDQSRRFKGLPIAGYPLAWPRTGVVLDGSILPSNVVPRELEYAQMALAVIAFNHNATMREPQRNASSSATGAAFAASLVVNQDRVLPVAAFASPDALLNVLFERGALSVVASKENHL